MVKSLTYFILGAVLAAFGVGSFVRHFTSPGNMPDIGTIPFWIAMGTALVLAGVWFALRGHLERIRNKDRGK
jgi:hypothetical protein